MGIGLLTLSPLYGMKERIAEERQSRLNEILLEACSRGFVEVVEALLDQGAQLTARDEDGETPLHLAIRNKNLEIAAFLLRRGADVVVKNMYGIAPLHLAANYDYNVSLCTGLLDKGTPVNIAADDMTTPFHLLCILGDSYDLLSLFLSRGADPHAINNVGRTPFSYAVQGNCIGFCRILLAHTTLKPAQDSKEVTPFRNRLKTALLCFMRINLPYVVQSAILEHDSVLLKERVTILYYDFCNGHSLAPHDTVLLQRMLPTYTREMLKPLLVEALNYATTDEMRALLDPEKLKETHGNLLTKTIDNKLAILQ